MKPMRAGYPLFLSLVLVACGRAAAPIEDESGSAATDANGNVWVPVPTSEEPAFPDDDPSFVPVSIKVPSGSSAGRSSSSSSSTSSSGGYESTGPFFTNDIDVPELAGVCADRAAAKGSYALTPSDARIPANRAVSVTRDLTEHRYGDGIYRTTFTLFFRGQAELFEDEEHGRTRREELHWLNVHLAGTASHPSAFAVGQPEAVEIGWAPESELFACSVDGTGTEWLNVESLPYEKGIVTLTRRDATGIGGTLDLGAAKLTFDAPYGAPGEDGICCLR